MSFDATVIQDLWCCPKSHSKLVVSGDNAVCSDGECRLQYAIKDGIPVMLIDEATTLSTDDWKTVMATSGRST